MNEMYKMQATLACYDNTVDAFVPELWAHEG